MESKDYQLWDQYSRWFDRYNRSVGGSSSMNTIDTSTLWNLLETGRNIYDQIDFVPQTGKDFQYSTTEGKQRIGARLTHLQGIIQKRVAPDTLAKYSVLDISEE